MNTPRVEHLRSALRGLQIVREAYTTTHQPTYLCNAACGIRNRQELPSDEHAVRVAHALWVRALDGYNALEGWCRHNGAGLSYFPNDTEMRQTRVRWLDKMIRDVKAQLKKAQA